MYYTKGNEPRSGSWAHPSVSHPADSSPQKGRIEGNPDSDPGRSGSGRDENHELP